MRRFMVVAAMAAFLTGCSDTTGPDGASRVQVQFAASSPVAATPGLMSLDVLAPGVRSITLAGSNGTLVIETAHVIVDEFELKPSDDDGQCEDAGDMGGVDEDACEEFDAGPSFVELGLDAGPTAAAEAMVPAGSYDRIDFEVEDLEADESDPGEAQQIADMLATIHEQFPDWPQAASMRVSGTFTPAGGEPQPFVAYFQAEIEVELAFDTPFVVTEGEGTRTITVQLNPSDWFTRSDGTVLDLTEFDYGTTGQVVEFEFEMEHGFEGVEHDD